MTTIFEKILAKELPAEILYEDDQVMVIQDIHPVAKVHLLILPKKHFSSIQEVTQEDAILMMHVVTIAQKMAKEQKIENGYRLLTNCGSDAGQTIFHLHFHLIGGQVLGAMA